VVGLSVNIVCSKILVSRVLLSLAPSFRYQIENADAALSKKLKAWLDAYLEGVSTPLLSPSPSSLFTQKVLGFLSKIPFGKTMSYGEVANALGSPRASRAVGNGCRVNPYPLFIPCHRVVGKNGLGGYSAAGKSSLEIKGRLLAFESSFT